MTRPALSVSMIVRDEAANLPGCLASLEPVASARVCRWCAGPFFDPWSAEFGACSERCRDAYGAQRRGLRVWIPRLGGVSSSGRSSGPMVW